MQDFLVQPLYRLHKLFIGVTNGDEIKLKQFPKLSVLVK